MISSRFSNFPSFFIANIKYLLISGDFFNRTDGRSEGAPKNSAIISIDMLANGS